MRTKVIKVYTFEELSKDAKQKVLESFSDINVMHDWHEFTLDYMKEKWGKFFDIENIYFSGFYSQGDGAMFEYSGVTEELESEFEATLSKRHKAIFRNCYTQASGRQRGMYYHENSCEHSFHLGCDFDLDTYPNCFDETDAIAPKWEEFIEDKYRDACHDIYVTLRNEYEYLTGEEAIVETILANEYEFTEDGEQF